MGSYLCFRIRTSSGPGKPAATSGTGALGRWSQGYEGPRSPSKKERHQTEARSSGTGRLLSPAKNQSGSGRGLAQNKALTVILHDLGIAEGGRRHSKMRDRGPDTLRRVGAVRVTRKAGYELLFLSCSYEPCWLLTDARSQK